MRILIITASYAPVLGGLQTVTAQLARGLQERGHEVLVLTNRYPRSLPRAETIDGVPVRRWLFLWPKLAYWRQRRPDLGLASLFYGPATQFRLRQLLTSWQPEVINVQFPDSQIPFLLRERGIRKSRLIVSIHGNEIERFNLQSSDGNVDDVRTLLKRAQAVTACSAYLLGVVAQIVPDIDPKSRVIYNGFDPSRFDNVKPFRHTNTYALAYGRLVADKGFDLLLEAWALCKGENEYYHLIIAGDGDLRKALQQQIEELGLDDRVYLLGRVTPTEVRSLLAGSKFVIVSSRRESFGIVALEALAAGRRILATEVGGLPELLSHAAEPSAYELVPPTVKGLAVGLRSMMNSQVDEFEANLNEFTWEQVIDRYEQVLVGKA